MSQPAIRVSHLTKQYQLGGSQEDYQMLRDSVANLAKRVVHPFAKKPPTNQILALNDVNFEVPQGETLGIIGRNGAGKSTLLKVFSKITEPTSGKVEMLGRVASLLEVGTGFHQELTGRENVFLNGAVLGMSRKEIERKFDAIVAFSEVEKFIDTPVKRYSSGMQLRLAFAVAAHLEPEILVIDEVLAVGDASFQRRCIDRMKELARSGCTLLFVSHNMEMIPTLCRSALWMRSGQVVEYGSSHAVTDAYLASLSSEANEETLSNVPHGGDGRARFVRLNLLDGSNSTLNAIKTYKDLRCLLTIDSTDAIPNAVIAIVIKTLTGTRLISSWTEEVDFRADLMKGEQTFECRFKRIAIRPGRQVAVELWMSDGAVLDHVESARILDVIEAEPCGFSVRADQGSVLCDYEWSRLS
jgi:lipopolysaccharide transport system ATP-binding protein